jgi:mannosyltransferase
MARFALSESRSKQTPLLFGTLLAILLLGMGLRLYDLDADSLWLDEVKTVTTSEMGLTSMLSFQATDSVHPPLLYLVTRLCVALFGDSDFAVRLQAALLGSISVLLTYKLGEMLWSREAGVVAAFLLAISAFHIEYSQEARHYSLMVFFSLFSLIFLVKALRGGQKRMWLLFGLCTSLNMYTHYFAFLVLPAELLFASWVIVADWPALRGRSASGSRGVRSPAGPNHLPTVTEGPSSCGETTWADRCPRPSPRKQALCLAVAVASVGAAYLPWLPSMQQQLAGQYIEYEGLGLGTVPRTVWSMGFYREVFAAFAQAEGIPLVLLLALFVLGLARSRARHAALLALWIAVPLLFPLIVRSSHFFSPRYAIFVVPIFFLGIAAGTSALKDWLTRRLPAMRDHEKARLAFFSVVTVAIFGGLAVTPIRDYYLGENDDYRDVAHYLQQILQPGDVVVTDGTAYRKTHDADWTQLFLSRYMGAYDMEQTPILRVERGFWANLQDVAHSDGEVFAVLASRKERAAWHDQTEVTIVAFRGLYVARLPQPSGDLLQDSVSMLEALADLLRVSPGASFDVHLALAEAYADLGRQAETDSHVVLASTVMPDDDRAAHDLADTINELQPFLRVQLEDLRLDDTLSMRGHSVYPSILRAGEPVGITLWWEVVARMDRDYTAFIHILGPDGHVLAQQDRQLQYATRPTSRWSVGEVIIDEYEVFLPPDAQPGQYVVKAGVYCWETGERLPVWDGQGQRVPDDAVTLGTISVTASETTDQ